MPKSSLSPTKKGTIVSFINYKGGVGKTTTTYHIACALAYYHDKKVLMVDIDPQTNLTFLCVHYDSWRQFKNRNGTIATLYNKFRQRQSFNVHRAIWQAPIGRDRFTKVNGVDLIPCDLDLLGEDLGGATPSSQKVALNVFQALKQGAKHVLREWFFLREVLDPVVHKYDYVLIDCPPNLYLMTQNALVASDFYVITTIPEYLSVIGLEILQQKIRGIAERLKRIAPLAGKKTPDVAKLGGIIFVKVRVGGDLITRQHDGQMSKMREKYAGYCFEAFTTELIGYSEAAEARLPVWLTSTSNAERAAQKREYERITDEFLRRIP